LGQGFVDSVLVFEFGLHLLQLQGDAENDCFLLDLTHLQVVFWVLHVCALLFQFVISLLFSYQVLVKLLDQLFLNVNPLIGQVVNFIKRHKLFFPDHEIQPFCSLWWVLILDFFLLFFKLIELIELHLFEHGFGHKVFGELEPFFFDKLILVLNDLL
jgi:hypothetical protein